MKPVSLLVLFGGKSPEHDVSCMSAYGVLSNLNPDLFRVFAVGITKEGAWLYTPGELEAIRDGSWSDDPFCLPCSLSLDPGRPGLLVFDQGACDYIPIDCVFPVLHGANGEDGTVQGLFELAGLPYVGCGVAASANCMDKAITKQLAASAGVRQADWRPVTRAELLLDPIAVTHELMEALPFPMFVKPARAGSSVGISRATDETTLAAALAMAATVDSKLVVEEGIRGRELEVAVIGNSDPIASVAGEIRPTADFYDYNAKYVDNTTDLLIPAPLTEAEMDAVTDAAVAVYRALGCEGLSRVDFFLSDEGEVIFNEINTLPGFTPISMYPKLFGHMGISYSNLLTFLVELAMERAGRPISLSPEEGAEEVLSERELQALEPLGLINEKGELDLSSLMNEKGELDTGRLLRKLGLLDKEKKPENSGGEDFIS